MAATGNAEARGGRQREIEALEYPACPGAPPLPAWDGWLEAADEGTRRRPATSQRIGDAKSRRASSARRTGQTAHEKTRGNRLKPGRERGPQEGRQAEREAQAAAACGGSRAPQAAAGRAGRELCRRARPLSARGGAGGGEAGAGRGGAHSAPRSADGSAAADRRGARGAGAVGAIVGGAAARSQRRRSICGPRRLRSCPI